MRRVRVIDQNRTTYLRGLEGFESTCCTVEVSAWRLPADGLPCTELILLIMDDDDDGCGEDSDITLLRPSGDGVISLPCVGRREGGVRLGRWDNVVGESSATDSRGVAGDTRTLSSVAISEEGTLVQQPMGLMSEYSRNT